MCGNCPANLTACYSCNGIPVTLPNAGVVDVCGVCDGGQKDKSKCVRPPLSTPAIAGAATAGGVVGIVGLFALVAAYLRWKKGANWLIKDVMEEEEIVGVNPLYEASGREQFNALYIGVGK